MLRLRVNEILKQQHKSRYWLNNQMGMTYTNLRRIIDNETTSIRYDTLEKLCRVLNCSPSELMKLYQKNPKIASLSRPLPNITSYYFLLPISFQLFLSA